MTYFANHADIFPDVTDLTRLITGLINDFPTIDKCVDIMGGYRNLGMVIETANTAEVIWNNKEAVVGA